MLCFGTAWAQNGTLTGKFTDAATGEPVPFAAIAGPNGTGTTTDFDGVYTLSLPAGTHEIKFSNVGYTAASYTVTITSGQETVQNHKAATQTQAQATIFRRGGKTAGPATSTIGPAAA